MNRRLLVGIGAFVLLIVLAGCLGATSESGLTEDASYDWETDSTVTIDLDEGAYTAVIQIEETEEFRVYQSTRYGTEHPVGVRSVQFRYPNGTVVNASEIGIRETRSSVYIDPPAQNGTIAYTASKQSKEFTSPVLRSGDWEIILPEGHRVDNMILATVRPGGYNEEVIDDRVHLTWDELASGQIRIQYYLARDLYLFGGLILAAGIAGAIGIGYVYRQILNLRRKREELGLDLDMDDEFGRDPPRGMG